MRFYSCDFDMKKFDMKKCSQDSLQNGTIVLILWWIRRVTCFSVEKISSDPSQAQVDQKVHLRISQWDVIATCLSTFDPEKN